MGWGGGGGGGGWQLAYCVCVSYFARSLLSAMYTSCHDYSKLNFGSGPGRAN